MNIYPKMAVLAESVEQVVEVLERFRIPQLAEVEAAGTNGLEVTGWTRDARGRRVWVEVECSGFGDIPTAEIVFNKLGMSTYIDHLDVETLHLPHMVEN